MDRSDIIGLIEVRYSTNEYGVQQKTEQPERTVMCQVQSVTQNEFFEGGRNGLNPELVFRVFSADYNDESVVAYKGKRYGVYRTYVRKDDFIELYCERKGGTNGGN